MNTILQKRIEEAANITVQNLYDCAGQMRNPEVSKYDEGYLDAIALQGDFLFREGANYALSNQWISVEEALPEIKEHFVSEDVLCRYSDDSIGFSRLKVNLFGQKWFEYEEEDSHVTHWMPIPEMKGGEK